MRDAPADPKPIRRTLRTYRMLLTTGFELIVALADADVHAATVFRPGGVSPVPVYDFDAVADREEGGDVVSTHRPRWRMALIPPASIVALIPCPPRAPDTGDAIPIPPTSIPGWLSGTDDDSILLEFGAVVAPGRRPGIII